MNAENFSFDNGANTEIIKHFCAVFPGVSISILSYCFIIETIDSSNLSGLVVSSEQCNMSWVLKLEAQEELESFDRVVPSVNKVTHENIASIGDLSTLIK